MSGRSGSSRRRTDRLLADLRAGGFVPGAWLAFLADGTARSLVQAAAHPRALAEVSALHAGLAAAASRSGRRRVAWGYALTVLHLGLLEDRPGLSLADVLTVLRGQLPALAGPQSTVHLGRWVGVLAAGLDLVDGPVARYRGSTTPFGRYADPLADAAVWGWIAHTYAARPAQAAVALVWGAPTVSVLARSFARGSMVDPPRPRWVRPAPALEVLLALHVVREGGRRDPPDPADRALLDRSKTG